MVYNNLAVKSLIVDNIIPNTGSSVAFGPVTSSGTLNNDLQFTSTAAETVTVTLTASEFIGGLIVGTPAAAVNYTLPAAADVVTALKAAGKPPAVGSTFRVIIQNASANPADVITIVAGTGNTLAGTATFGDGLAHEIVYRLTNVTAAAEAATAYLFPTV